MSLELQRKIKKKNVHTKYVYPKLSKDWRKESINKTNKPPGDIEGDRNWKKNHTAKCRKRNIHQ